MIATTTRLSTMASTTSAKLSEEEIDDLLYFARAGELEEFNTLKSGR